MYTTIRRTVSRTTNGTYKRKDWYLDFERLPWVHWLDIEPLTKQQRRIFQVLYPILLQEMNCKKPSSLLHFLVGKGVLFWQDVIIIRNSRQTDLEQNTPLLRIIQTRGQAGFRGLIEGLRTRYGAWQGYLADMLEGNFSFIAIRDMTDIYKIVCHDLIKISPVGWSALPRALGLRQKSIEQCRRENKLLSNQVLHSLLMWTGQREDTDQLLAELLAGLRRIHRADIAAGLVVLLTTIQGIDESHAKTDDEEAFANDNFDNCDEQRIESGISTMVTEGSEIEELFERDRNQPSARKGRRYLKSVDSGFAPSSPGSSRRSTSATPYSPTPPPLHSSRQSHRASTSRNNRKIPTMRNLPPEEGFSRMQTGKLYSYELTPRTITNAWEKRKPSILQLDYMTHPNHDNMFMDYLVHQ